MKKTYVFILIIVLIALFSSSVFASSGIKVRMLEEEHEVREIDIKINGKTQGMEAPAFVLGGRTMVPVRFIAEGLGAKVDWIGESQTVLITRNNKIISMTLNSDKVTIDGKGETLDQASIPRLASFLNVSSYPNAGSRTMVPIRFISEVLGLDVEWDGPNGIVSISEAKSESQDMAISSPAKTIVNNISLEESKDRDLVGLRSTGEIEYSTMYIDATNKIVVDVKDARLDIGSLRDTPGNIKVDNGVVEKVQYSQFTVNPFITRLVVTLYEKAPYQINLSRDKKNLEILIDSKKTDRDNFESVNRGDAPIKEDNIDEIIKNEEETDENIEIEDIIEDEEYKEYNESEPNDKDFMPIDSGSSLITKVVIKKDEKNNEYIQLEGLSDPKYSTFKLIAPKRYVVDIKNAVIEKSKIGSYNTKIGNAEKVRVAQFARKGLKGEVEDIVRMVFDLKDDFVSYEDLSVIKDGRNSKIIEDRSSWDNFTYSYNNEKTMLSLKLNNSNKHFEYDYSVSNRTLSLEIPNKFLDFPLDKWNIYDGYLQSIEIKRGSSKSSVEIRFSKDVTIRDRSPKDSLFFEVELVNKKNDRKKTIVVDPGHGGKDSGAVNSLKQLEKTHNLIVSLKLRTALEREGYNVIMTRDTDETLNLYGRPEVANSANADLFISVHANAGLTPNAKGLEVIYCPANKSLVEKGDQYPFAKSIYDNIVKLTGRSFGRGLVDGSQFVVLNRTKMPAIILETGYMSNVEENSLIWTDEYQSKIIKGVVNGVNEYLKFH